MHRAEGRRTTLVAHRSGWWDRVVLLVMVATAVGRGLGARGAAVQETSWETRWNGSQAAWVEDDDAEVALDLLEQALALRPPPDAENKMLEQLVPILEGVKDGLITPAPPLPWSSKNTYFTPPTRVQRAACYRRSKLCTQR